MAYSRLSSEDSEIQIILNGASCHPEDTLGLRGILQEPKTRDDATFLAFITFNGVFLMHILPAAQRSANTVADAHRILTDFIKSSECSRALMYCLQPSSGSGEQEKYQSRFAIITRWDDCSKRSLALSREEVELLDSYVLASKKRTLGRKRCFGVAAILVIAIIVFLFTLSQRLSGDKAWVRYSTEGSVGPKYQLQFTHHNVSEWVHNNPHDDGDWALRIDDQALIPAHLLDEEEIRYQKWYQDRYPDMNEVRTKQLYIDETFLGDPMAIQVPADKTFHMSHCVRALRRYWQAKETGKHVCPRDIDYRHMKHCLDSLDEWAFPSGKRLENQSSMEQEEDNWVLIWETKVCFD